MASRFSHLLSTKKFVVLIENDKGKPFMFESTSPVTVHTIRRFIVNKLKQSIGLDKEDVLFPYQIIFTNPNTKEVYDKIYFNNDIHLVMTIIREDNRLTKMTRDDLTSLIAFAYFKNRNKLLEILDKYKSFVINPVKLKMLDDESTLILLDTIYTNDTIEKFIIDENNEEENEEEKNEEENEENDEEESQ